VQREEASHKLKGGAERSSVKFPMKNYTWEKENVKDSKIKDESGLEVHDTEHIWISELVLRLQVGVGFPTVQME
jgi:hypothetical protein